MSYNSTIYINIKQLLQTRDAEEFYVPGKKMDELPKIHNAFLLVKNGSQHLSKFMLLPQKQMGIIIYIKCFVYALQIKTFAIINTKTNKND